MISLDLINMKIGISVDILSSVSFLWERNSSFSEKLKSLGLWVVAWKRGPSMEDPLINLCTCREGLEQKEGSTLLLR